MIVYDGYEFESPVEAIKRERLAELLTIAFSEANDMMGVISKTVRLYKLATTPLFPPRGCESVMVVSGLGREETETVTVKG